MDKKTDKENDVFLNYIELLFSNTKSALFLFSDDEKYFFNNFDKNSKFYFDSITIEKYFILYMSNHRNNLIKIDDEFSPDTYLRHFEEFFNKNDIFYNTVVQCINFIKNKISLFTLLQNTTLSSTNASFNKWKINT